MRKYLFIFLPLLTVIGCTKQKSTDLSTQQWDVTKKEINTVVDALFMSCERCDLDGSLQSYLNSPDFLVVGIDGSSMDYEALKETYEDFFESASSMELHKSQRWIHISSM